MPTVGGTEGTIVGTQRIRIREREREREIGHLPSAARVTGAMNYTLDIILRQLLNGRGDESNKSAASADKRGHGGEKQGDIKTGGRTPAER
ncbi:hypothetical protein ALC56_03821 [Trachymyrmex septentrionalis]|uniref:Uncharacterized protein n=1 Tax=Trachymyrmex septentrionalis TaxID=34720 RepID=A0A151JZ36_9HYME|nr:hypothetical protein ALC56_03821 [Trachymyrmex septentrionalis]